MSAKKIPLCVIFLLLIGSAAGQQSTNTAGATATGSGGTATFSVGQVVYETTIDSKGSVAQGVQQPFEISEMTGITKVITLLTCSVYPNPTTKQLILNTETLLAGMSYTLTDMSGKCIVSNPVCEKISSIDLGNSAPGTYLLLVMQDNQVIKTFKIVKHE